MWLKRKGVEIHTNIRYENLEDNVDVDMRITLKWMLKSKIRSCKLDPTVSAQQQLQAIVKIKFLLNS